MSGFTDGALPQDTRGVSSDGVYVANIGTVAQQGVNVQTDSSGQAYATTSVQLASGTSLAGQVAVSSGLKATYTYAISATAPYATPTDWIVIRGSATKTIKIIRIEISGAATAATEVLFNFKKHTVANTGGANTTPAPMQHDSNDGVSTAVVFLFSGAPTIDASATIWKNIRLDLDIAPAASAAAVDRYVYNYGAETSEPLTLRGIAQEFAINYGGVAVPSGGVYDVAITYTEE